MVRRVGRWFWSRVRARVARIGTGQPPGIAADLDQLSRMPGAGHAPPGGQMGAGGGP